MQVVPGGQLPSGRGLVGMAGEPGAPPLPSAMVRPLPSSLKGQSHQIFAFLLISVRLNQYACCMTAYGFMIFYFKVPEIFENVF